jgi:hypothetical protein
MAAVGSSAEWARSAYRLLRDMIVLLGAVGLLWLLHIHGRTLSTAALVAIWVALALAIGGGAFWRSRMRRRALLAVYLAPDTRLQRWLRGGWVMAGRQLLVGSLLALVLGVAVVRTPNPWTWTALVITAPALVGLQALLRHALARQANRRYLPELSWRLALAFAGCVLFTVVVLLALYQQYPNFTGVTLERAVWHMVDRELARSDGLQLLLQLAAAKDGLRLWLAQQLLPLAGGTLLQFAAWTVVLAEEALFVWSYVLFCNGVVLGAQTLDRTNVRHG